MILLTATNPQIRHQGFKPCGRWQTANHLMGQQRRTVEVKTLIHKMIERDFGWDRRILLTISGLVIAAELMLHQFAIESPQPPHGKILTGQKAVASRNQTKRLQL